MLWRRTFNGNNGRNRGQKARLPPTASIPCPFFFKFNGDVIDGGHWCEIASICIRKIDRIFILFLISGNKVKNLLDRY